VTAFLLTLVAFALAGCGGVAKQPAALEGGRPAASQAGPDAADQPSKTAADQARLSEQVSRIAGELSELQNAVAKLIASSRLQEDQLTYLRRRVEELESLNRGRLPAAPSGFAPSAPGGVAPPAPGGFAPPAPSPGPTPLASATTTPVAELYRAGTEKLQAKNFDAAVLSFYDLIVTYPNHPLREGAQFLVADIFYMQKDFRSALAEFEALIAAVPRGERVPDALLKIGQCQKSLGDAARAKRTWERVVKDHPASVAAREARVLLRN
jgi:tol-pal system protein YbgF